MGSSRMRAWRHRFRCHTGRLCCFSNQPGRSTQRYTCHCTNGNQVSAARVASRHSVLHTRLRRHHSPAGRYGEPCRGAVVSGHARLPLAGARAVVPRLARCLAGARVNARGDRCRVLARRDRFARAGACGAVVLDAAALVLSCTGASSRAVIPSLACATARRRRLAKPTPGSCGTRLLRR